MSTTRLFFARALLVAGEMQRGPQYEQALVAVMTGEDSTAWWNPMDTTLGTDGATPYNSFGPGDNWHVWNYPSAEVGIKATIDTLKQPNMARFYDAMCKPDMTSLELTEQFSFTPWGGIGDKLPLLIVSECETRQRSYVADRRNKVFGPGPWPYRANGEPFC